MADASQLHNIIEECRKGSNEAFSQLVDMYSSRLYGYFYRLTYDRELSHDLLGDLFLKLIKKIKKFKDGSFDKWIFTVASNLFHDYLRKKYRDTKLMKHITSECEHLENQKHDDFLLDSLQISLEKLDPETRELLVLRYYSNISFKELADIRSEPIGTTLSKVHRGLKQLRELMEKEK